MGPTVDEKLKYEMQRRAENYESCAKWHEENGKHDVANYKMGVAMGYRYAIRVTEDWVRWNR